MQPISSVISSYLRRAAALPSATREVLNKELLSPWILVDALKLPVGALDTLAGARDPILNILPGEEKRGDGTTAVPHAWHHEYLDGLVGSLRTSATAKAYFYNHGLGRTHLLPEFADELAGARMGKAAGYRGIDPPPAEIMFSEPTDTKGRGWCRVINGSFPVSAPMRALLPPESWVAHFQMCLPVEAWYGSAAASSTAASGEGAAGPSTDAKTRAVVQEMAEARPLAIILPGTGEHGFERRRHMVGMPLARLGIGSIILDGPYYGARKPTSQDSSRLPCFMDLCVLGRATIDEAVALARWATSVDRETIDGLCEFDGRNSTEAQRRHKLEQINKRQVELAAKAAGPGYHNGSNYFVRDWSSSGNAVVAGPARVGSAESTDSRANRIVDEEEVAADTSSTSKRANTKPLRKSAHGGLMHDLRLERDRISASIAYGAVLASSPAASSTSSPPQPPSSSSSSSSRGFGCVLVAGTSMGGLHAAMSASAAKDLPLGVVSWVGPPSAGGVFTLGQLAKAVDWEAVARDAREGTLFKEQEQQEVKQDGAPAGQASKKKLQFWVGAAPASPREAAEAAAAAAATAASTTKAVISDAMKWAASAASLDGFTASAAASTRASSASASHDPSLLPPPFDPALLALIPPEPFRKPVISVPFADSRPSGGASSRGKHWDNVLEMEARLMKIDSRVFHTHSHCDDVLYHHRDMLAAVLDLPASSTTASTANAASFGPSSWNRSSLTSTTVVSGPSGTRTTNQLIDAVALAARLLRITDINNFVAPMMPGAATFIQATHDLYVPKTRSLVSQWKSVREQWPGAVINQVVGGHVSACILHSDTYAATVVQTIRRMRGLMNK